VVIALKLQGCAAATVVAAPDIYVATIGYDSPSGQSKPR
jgi:hypothetical protein